MEKLQALWESFRKWFDSVWDFHRNKILIAAFLILVLGNQLIQVIKTPDYDYTIGWAVGIDPGSYEKNVGELTELLQPYCVDRTGNGKIEIDVFMTDMMLDDKDSAYADAGKMMASADYSLGLCSFYVATEDAAMVLKNIEGMFCQDAYKFTFQDETMYILVCTDNGKFGDKYQDHLDIIEKMAGILEPVVLKPSIVI